MSQHSDPNGKESVSIPNKPGLAGPPVPRIDTPAELDYYRHCGILQAFLRKILRSDVRRRVFHRLLGGCKMPSTRTAPRPTLCHTLRMGAPGRRGNRVLRAKQVEADMIPRRWRLYVGGLVAILIGMPLAESAKAGTGAVGGIIDSAINLGLSIASLAGDS